MLASSHELDRFPVFTPWSDASMRACEHARSMRGARRASALTDTKKPYTDIHKHSQTARGMERAREARAHTHARTQALRVGSILHDVVSFWSEAEQRTVVDAGHLRLPAFDSRLMPFPTCAV